MKFVIDINKEKLRKSIEDFLIGLVRYTYSWLSNDGEILGYIIGVYHILIAFCILIMIFVTHTIYPNVWLKLYILICLGIIFAQHVFFEVCLLIPIEENLTKQKTIFYPFLEKCLKPFHITVEQFILYLVISEGTAIACFSLELLSEFCKFLVFALS
jgi:hypothetical protein